MMWFFLQSFLSVFLWTFVAFLSKIVSYNIEHDLEETSEIFSLIQQSYIPKLSPLQLLVLHQYSKAKSVG